MSVYADTSVLVSAFTPDDHTSRARTGLATRPALIISNWTTAEFATVIRRQARKGRISRSGVEAAAMATFDLALAAAARSAGAEVVDL